MDTLLEKLSSYNLFNYLFSGVVFVVLSSELTVYSFIQDDIIIGLFLYYFIGLVLSRIGSLIVEPILKKITFIKFAKYSDFVKVSKLDSNLEILSEANNIYRTLISVFVGLIFLKMYEFFQPDLVAAGINKVYVLLAFLLIIFLFSYQKQTSYITKRISANLEKHE